jgi:CRP-like cAMP-binding protein
MDIKNYIKAIAHINLFKGFTSCELISLFKTNKYKIKQYNKGEIIHLQNEVCNCLDIILVGTASVQKIDENGNILTISTFSSSDIMGANLLFSSRNYYPMTVVAKSDVVVLHMQRELILELCQNNMSFLIELIKAISDKTIILTDKIKSISLKTIRQCIIDYLKYEYHIQKNNVIKLDMSKKEMAERFGIQRPSLCRELNKMKKDGLVEYDAKSITIKDISIIDN